MTISNAMLADLYNFTGEDYTEDFEDTSISIETLIEKTEETQKKSFKFDVGEFIGEEPDYVKIQLKNLRTEALNIAGIAYQRIINVDFINRAGPYNKSLMQPLVVFKRPDKYGGNYLTIDGQHRAIIATFALSSEGSVMCAVFYHPQNRSLKECKAIEAQTFVKLNESRTTLKTLDKIRAGLSYNEAKSVEWNNNLTKLGLKIQGLGDINSEFTVNAPTKVEWSWNRKGFGMKHTQSAVDLLKKVDKEHWKKGEINGSLVQGLAQTYRLIDICGGGAKRDYLIRYLEEFFGVDGDEKWWNSNAGGATNGHELIAHKIVNQYHAVRDRCKKSPQYEKIYGFKNAPTIGPEVLRKAGIKDILA